MGFRRPLATPGLNPFMEKFAWSCWITRRPVSDDTMMPAAWEAKGESSPKNWHTAMDHYLQRQSLDIFRGWTCIYQLNLVFTCVHQGYRVLTHPSLFQVCVFQIVRLCADCQNAWCCVFGIFTAHSLSFAILIFQFWMERHPCHPRPELVSSSRIWWSSVGVRRAFYSHCGIELSHGAKEFTVMSTAYLEKAGW
jgi:hypothetical protein